VYAIIAHYHTKKSNPPNTVPNPRVLVLGEGEAEKIQKNPTPQKRSRERGRNHHVSDFVCTHTYKYISLYAYLKRHGTFSRGVRSVRSGLGRRRLLYLSNTAPICPALGVSEVGWGITSNGNGEGRGRKVLMYRVRFLAAGGVGTWEVEVLGLGGADSR
jgi:hypothetical protein